MRSLGSGSLFVTDFTSNGNGHVAFAPRFPGTIIPALLQAGQSLICRKETFLVAEKSISLETVWQRKIGYGFFGGDGFLLQKLTGPGVVWLDLSGELVERDLSPGERLLVHAGHVGVFEPSVTFDIQMVSGFKNILFGGEGLFLATLTGPATSGCKACRSSIWPRKSRSPSRFRHGRKFDRRHGCNRSDGGDRGRHPRQHFRRQELMNSPWSRWSAVFEPLLRWLPYSAVA